MAKEFEENNDAAVFLLGRNDIRDKYERDQRGRETVRLLELGVFERNGMIHDDVRNEFDGLLTEVQQFLKQA